MSSTPTIERRTVLAPSEEWVDVVPPRRDARYSSASVMVAISRAREALSLGDGIVIETDAFRPIDSADVDAATLADQRWDH